MDQGFDGADGAIQVGRDVIDLDVGVIAQYQDLALAFGKSFQALANRDGIGVEFDRARDVARCSLDDGAMASP